MESGSLVLVQGSGWSGTCGVELWFDGLEGELIGFAIVDQKTGTIASDAVIPADATPGVHEVFARGLGFAVEFCGEPDGSAASAEVVIVEAESREPVVQLSVHEGTPGSTIVVTGAGFCTESGCSAVDVWFGGGLAAAGIQVAEDGTFVTEVILPVVSPLGLTELFAVQTDTDGQTHFGYGEFETTVRPDIADVPPVIQENDSSVVPILSGGSTGRRIGPMALGVVSLLGLTVLLALVPWAGIRLRRLPILRLLLIGVLGVRLRRGLFAAGLAAVVLLPVTFATAGPPLNALTDVNPDGLPSARFGGRAIGLTVSPTNALTVYTASELGGAWRSSDGGTNWTHVDEINTAVTRDVFFDPQDSSILIATGRSNGSTTTPGGVWVSSNGGTSWTQPATAIPPCTSQPTFWSGAIPNDPAAHVNVYIGTSCGIAISGDSGGTWTHVDPCTSADAAWCTGSKSYFDVVAQVVGGMVQLDVCGDEGFFRSTDGGTTWSAPDPNSPARRTPNRNPCHVATAPGDPNTVFLANWSGVNAQGFCVSQLLESNSGGGAGTWNATTVTDSNCRDAWVVTHPALDGHGGHFEVYVGTSKRVRVQHCDLNNTPRCSPTLVDWPEVDSGAHSDPSDIAFDTSAPNGCPVVLSTDGGLSTSGDCGATWDDGNRGYHALDIRGFAGVIHGGHSDLYFGTQDNGLYMSLDNAATWSRPASADVYNVLADPVAPGRVFYRRCFGCGDNIADDHHANLAGFNDPPGTIPTTAVATQFGPQSYAFVTNDGAMPPTWSVWVTTNEGGNWSQMGPNLPGNPGEIKASGPAANPTFYLRLNVGGNRRIYRLTGAFDATATLALANTGLSRPSSAWDVDPSNPNLLYASDVTLDQMMSSTTGGAVWVVDQELTDLVTRFGTYPFSPSQTGSQPRAVAFDPNSSRVFVGTRTSGLFASATDGASWTEVPGGQALGFYRDFFFDSSDGAIYAATQGRGLWRVDLLLADLSIAKTDAPDPAVAGESLTYTVTVENGGPDTAHEVVVVDTLPSDVMYVSDTAPGGCVEAPVDVLNCDLGDIVNGGVVAFDIVVDIDPAAVFNAGGPITITNEATVSSSVVDTDATNDTVTEDTDVVAVADLEILSFAAIDPPAQIIVGDTHDVTLRKIITNNGPSAPMDVHVSVSATGTPGVTVVPAVQDDVAPAVGLGEMRQVDETFTLSCQEASNHSFTFTNVIEPNDPADTDPDLSNNIAEVTIDVVCVVPVQINIKPGSDPNSIDLGNSTVAVAVLTTEAGEYGLPLAFDATTIDPLSVRFGPADLVFNGLGGAAERHNRGHIQDSRELDEVTKDGDLDMMLHFRANETGLADADTEACVYGTWEDEFGDQHVFFGCDAIRVVPPK